VKEKIVSSQIKRHLIRIFSLICFLLLITFFDYTRFVLFLLIFIPFWGVFLILNGKKFFRDGEWYLRPLFGSGRVEAWCDILAGILFLIMAMGVIFWVLWNG